MSNVHFVIENGLLVQKLFVGPMPEVKIEPKHSIKRTLEEYEDVKESTLILANLKEQQVASAKVDAPVASNSNVESTNKHRVIRRRRKFVYHAANEIIDKGYWVREKRSLTKYHSNSLMFEYSVIK